MTTLAIGSSHEGVMSILGPLAKRRPGPARRVPVPGRAAESRFAAQIVDASITRVVSTQSNTEGSS
jgi:hypothetical protein